MTQEQANRAAARLIGIPAMAATVLTSLIVGGLGGGLGAYVALRVTLATVETRQTMLENQLAAHSVGPPHVGVEGRLSGLEAIWPVINDRFDRLEKQLSDLREDLHAR